MKDQTNAVSDLIVPPENITFSKFPAELRLKIMKEVVPGPRRITVVWDLKRRLFKTDAMPPVNLSISSEWRIEGLKTYTLAFGSVHSPATIPIDFSRDQINLTGDVRFSFYPTVSNSATYFNRIQKLRINSDGFTKEKHHYQSLVELDELKDITFTHKCRLHSPEIMPLKPPFNIREVGFAALSETMERRLTKASLETEFDKRRNHKLAQTGRDEVDTEALEEEDTGDKNPIPTLVDEMVLDDGRKCTRCEYELRIAIRADRAERFSELAPDPADSEEGDAEDIEEVDENYQRYCQLGMTAGFFGSWLHLL